MRTNSIVQTAIPVDEALVQERSVSVKVLTIGTRQVTQSLYKQLVEEDAINYDTGETKGIIWGWVNLHSDCAPGEHIHVVWEQNGILKKSRIDRKCKTKEHIRWQDHFIILAQIQMYNESLDGLIDAKEYLQARSKYVEYGGYKIWVPAPPYIDIIRDKWRIYSKEDKEKLIRKDVIRLLHTVKWISPKLFESQYIPWKMRYWPEGDMCNAIDRMGLEDDDWEQNYQTIYNIGQLFIAVSGVWK